VKDAHRQEVACARAATHGVAVRPLLFLLTFALLAGCGATIGDACTTEKDCGNGVCLNRGFTPGGYCSVSCTVGGAACPTGSVCVDNAIGRDVSGCLRTCASSKDCRGGYVCKTERNSGTPVCVGPEGI
jgi:hypothetical protein